MPGPSVVVLGGGVSGIAAAYTLARAGLGEVTVLEGGRELGGLAGSFEREGRFYPLGYHHILHRDRALLFFLDRTNGLGAVRWRPIRMLFWLGGRSYDLGHPLDFLRFPMSFADKLRFARLMARSFRKSDWSDWLDRSARDLVDDWAGPGVREAIFERLTRLKFELPAEEVSAAWLGARLHTREGSAALGYIPGTNWTKVLCDGLARLLAASGVRVRLEAPVRRLHTLGGRAREAELGDGERIGGDLFVSTVPTEVYLELVGGDDTPHLESIRYTALVSAVCASRRRVEPDFYWLNLASLDRSACGIFVLSSLNPTIGAPGETCVNFVTHVQGRQRPFFARSDAELLEGYLADFRAVLGHDLDPFWTHVVRVPMYSPVLHARYRNPPVRSTSFPNLYLAGNYRTFPSSVTTGTALASGVEAGEAILADLGRSSDLGGALASFRLTRRPRP